MGAILRIPEEMHDPREVVWAPQPGSQELFLTCPIYECLYEGTRGPGKTDALAMDFGQHVGVGYGAHWRGVLFRRTHPELEDFIAKTKKWFPLIWPGAKFLEGPKSKWRWPTGEELLLRHFAKPDDYWSYHGHEYPWIGWEEVTSWPDATCYKSMMSCSRSSHPGMPRKYRATTNPYGVGHNWVKSRWKLPDWSGRVIREAGQPPRTSIHGRLEENVFLLENDPDYMTRILAGARNASQRAAWSDGDWDIVAGGMFDDIFDRRVHVIRPFAIPRGWVIDRAFDWGSSRPFSVGWWAESDGSSYRTDDGREVHTVKGDLFLIAEWYGWNGQDNEGCKMLAVDVAVGIRAKEAEWGLDGRVVPGPADSSIFDEENGVNIATDMASKRVRWEKADKGPGSRKQGWEQTRKRMQGSIREPGQPRTEKGLFVFDTCEQWLRTVPVLPRDDDDLDDVDTESEDHAGDMTRYRVRFKRKVLSTGSM